MKRLIGLFVASLLSVLATAQNTVTAWNEIGITAARASSSPGSATAGGTGIYIAYMQLAAYNAVNAIDGRFEPYKYSISAPAGASVDAAVIEASYLTLLYLLPDQEAYLTDQYNRWLAAVPGGDAKSNGQMVGRASANELISLRANDGRGANVPYTFPSDPEPGVWILTPGATAPQTPWIGKMRPFTFDDPARFLPEPPLDLSTDTWARDFNEVKSLGRVNSTVRTPEQTQQALFWTDHGASQYGRMLRSMAAQRRLSVPDSARLFAMSYTAYADAFIGCMNAKYTYSFWRPVTAIRNADIDGNPETSPDPAWLPLVTTPNHPEYPSAHGCITGALAETMAAFFGTRKLPVTVDSTITGPPRKFDNIDDWQTDVSNARIYAGFHYRFSVRQGLILGHKVAHNLTAHFFRPVRGTAGNADAGIPSAFASQSSPIRRDAIAPSSGTVVGSGATTSSTIATTYSVTGNWWGTFVNNHVGNAHLWGPIVVSNGVISRTSFGFDTSECFYSGNITTGSVSGSTIKINIHLSDNFSSGAYLNLSGTVSGSNAMSGAFTVGKTFCSFVPSSGTWKITRVAKVTATWVGWTKKSGSSTTQSLKIALTQGSIVGALSTFNSYVTGSPTRMNSSVFQVKGQFGSSGSSCVSAAATAASGVLAGGIGGLQINFGTNASTGVRLYGEFTGIGATKMTGTYKLASGSCKGQTGTFSLSRM